jgi:hypothetical protein
MSRDTVQQKKLSRAALEVLAIIAYHQPVTRAEIEDIRGVETSKGTLDTLMETELDPHARTAPHAGSARDLWHDGRVPRSFRARGNPRPARHRRIEGRRPAVRRACRPASRFHNRHPTPTCWPTTRTR